MPHKSKSRDEYILIFENTLNKLKDNNYNNKESLNEFIENIINIDGSLILKYLSGKESRVGHRVYDILLIDTLREIRSGANREKAIRYFIDDIININSKIDYIALFSIENSRVNSLNDIKIEEFKTNKRSNIKKEVLDDSFNIRARKEYSSEIENSFKLLNDLIEKKESAISWSSRWSNLYFVLKFVPAQELQKGGWLNIVYLKKPTANYPHKFLAFWYADKNAFSKLPIGFTQDERALMFFRNYYQLISYSIKNRSKTIYENKMQLLNQIAPSIIGHEILTNITQPINNLKQIKDKNGCNEYKDVVENILSMLQTSKAMADNLLVLTKRAKNNTININKLFNKIYDIVSLTLSKDSASLVINAKDYYIKSDEGLLMQVVINLIMNALEAYKESSTKNNRKIYLNLSVNQEENYFFIDVADNAIGIKQSIFKRVFEQGFTTKKSYGHGLGLTIVEYIVSFLNGSIEVYSPYKSESLEYKTLFRLKFSNSSIIEAEIEEEVLNVSNISGR